MINEVRSAQLVQAAQIAPAIAELAELANDLFVAFCVHGHPLYQGQGRHRLLRPRRAQHANRSTVPLLGQARITSNVGCAVRPRSSSRRQAAELLARRRQRCRAGTHRASQCPSAPARCPSSAWPSGRPGARSQALITRSVRAVMTARNEVLPDARSSPGIVPGFEGEGFDWPVEPVPGRASDHGAFQRPVCGAHGEPARHLGRKPAPSGAVFVEVGRAVKEHHRGPRYCAALSAWTAAAAVRYQASGRTGVKQDRGRWLVRP